jgi:hypothetical protein
MRDETRQISANYQENGLERFGGIYNKLNDFYLGNCDQNDLKDELELLIIMANRMLKIPKILMDYIKELNEIIGPYHWNEKITSRRNNNSLLL